MKILRWLLSHSLLILLIVAVIYSYMFWGNLAGKDTPVGKALAYLSSEFVEVDEFINAVKAKQAELSGEQTAESEKQVTVTAEVTETVTAPGSVAEEESGRPGTPPANISYSHNNTQVEQDSAADIVSGTEASPNQLAAAAGNQQEPVARNTQTAAAPMPAGNTGDVFVPQEIEQQLNKVDDKGNVITESAQSDNVRASWITARKSFYQRNYELSEQSYQKVIDSTEDNYDAYGELGNVYFNQGKNKQAAAAYFEAAAILVRKGQVSRAQSLMGLLRHLDKNKANELQQLVDSAQS